MRRQRWTGEPGQHGHAGAPGTMMPAQTGPVLSPPLQKGVPSSKGPGCISAGQCHPTSRLCQRKLLQAFLPQPVPGKVLAGDHAHHLPGKGQGTAHTGMQSLGTRAACPVPLQP